MYEKMESTGLLSRVQENVRIDQENQDGDTNSMETVRHVVRDVGKGLVPLYYDSDQEPSFRVLKHMMAKANQEILPRTRKLCVFSSTTPPPQFDQVRGFCFFFASRTWISETRAEIEWWFPREYSVTKFRDRSGGVTVLRSVYQIASLRLDMQMPFLRVRHFFTYITRISIH